jgi:hypothetical protein
MKTKKTLKLTLETIRRLDLDATQGGHHLPQMRSREPSCGIGCIVETDTLRPPEPDTNPLTGSLGFGCMPGPIHSRYTQCL